MIKRLWDDSWTSQSFQSYLYNLDKYETFFNKKGTPPSVMSGLYSCHQI